MLLRYGWSGDVEVVTRSVREIVAEGMMPQKMDDGTLRLTNRLKRFEANRKLAGIYTRMDDDGDFEGPCEAAGGPGPQA